MDLSIIVVSYNSERWLRECLSAVADRLARIRAEVVLVDNASTDGSVSLVSAEFPWVRLIRNATNRGFAAAVNRGLAASRGGAVLWLNPDAVLLDDGMVELVRYLEAHREVGIVGPQLVDPDGAVQRSARAFPSYEWPVAHRRSIWTRLVPWNPYSRRYLRTDADPTRIQEVDWVSGACLLHRREVADALGGLDERFFMYCEDVDFCLRARQHGWVVRYHPGARVRHHLGGSTATAERRMLVEQHRSLWRYYLKHFPRRPVVDPLAWLIIWGRCGGALAAYRLRQLARAGRSRPHLW
jgi:GT2 family glycosyltransferase